MRLINAYTYEIEDYPSHVTPPYAILSHTWGSEEVTLKDLEAGDWLTRGDKREGREKIKGLCAAAATEGYEYVWIDTCCIDKTSSAELSEAINSMFRWYYESAICFAYLSDVDSAQDPTTIDSNFAKSRWFMRGWTLQELLAPKEIVFVGRDWGEIGTKNTLRVALSIITHISQDALTSRSFDAYSVAQKMSWAANRETTRPEDEAYCLVGLFDVNMPLLYGEGRRAFVRLQEEIMKRTDDESIFAWCHPPELQTHMQLTGMLASSPSDFRYSSNISITAEASKDRYLNPFELVRQHVRIRLPVIGPLKGIELAETDTDPGLCNIVSTKSSNDDAQQPNPLVTTEHYGLRSSDSLDSQPGAKRRKIDDSTWVAGLAAPRLLLDRFDGNSSIELEGEEDDENEAPLKKLDTRGIPTSWRWYIYAPVLVVPLACASHGRSLGILLSRGSCRSKEENVLYRLHSPSLVCIEDLSQFIHFGTPSSSIHAYANAKYTQSDVEMLQRTILEIRTANLWDTGYRMFEEQGGDWTFREDSKKLVKYQSRQQSRNSMALFQHGSGDSLSYPSFFMIMDLTKPYIGVLNDSDLPILGHHKIWRVAWGKQSRAEISLGGSSELFLVLKARHLDKVQYLSLSIEHQASHLSSAKVELVHHVEGLNMRLQRIWSAAMPDEDQDILDAQLSDSALWENEKTLGQTPGYAPAEQPLYIPHTPLVA